ncbi:hypothetical protein FRC03_009593 [Tulasnella sp. 419]|nr:hypothetical protein FRC03_009593 [Tulasnella sp. 419]
MAERSRILKAMDQLGRNQQVNASQPGALPATSGSSGSKRRLSDMQSDSSNDIHEEEEEDDENQDEAARKRARLPFQAQAFGTQPAERDFDAADDAVRALIGNFTSKMQRDISRAGSFFDSDAQEGVVLEIDRGGPDQAQLMAKFRAENAKISPQKFVVHDAMRYLGLRSLNDLVPGLDVRLLPHQAIGVAWMIQKERSKRERGGILADDMGLGKTVQAIATMVIHQADTESPEYQGERRRQTLIIGPAALLDQWRDEIETKSDMFRVFVHHGPGKAKTAKQLRKYDVIITSYQTMLYDVNPRTNKASRGPLASTKWFRIVLDEAQLIRNRSAQISIAAATLDSTHRWCMTGTPVTNSLTDLYPLLRFARLRPWNDWDDFNLYIGRVQKKNPELASQEAMKIVNKHFLRRTKDTKIDGEPILKLTPKTIDREMIEFTPDERKIYAAVEKRQQQRITKFLKSGTILKNYQFILVMILRLRQVCCHPQLIAYAAHELVDADPQNVVLDECDGDGEDDYAVNDLATAVKIMGQGMVNKLRKHFFDHAMASCRKAAGYGGDDEDSAGNDDECPICFEVFSDRRITVCGHQFCKDCIEAIFQTQVEYQNDEEVAVRPCPSCRANVRENQLFKAAIFEPSQEELQRIKTKVKHKKEAESNIKFNSKSFGFDMNLGDSDDDLPSADELFGNGKKAKRKKTKKSKKPKQEKKKDKVKEGRKHSKIIVLSDDEEKREEEEEEDDDDVIDLTADDIDVSQFPSKKGLVKSKLGKPKPKSKFIVDSSDQESDDDDDSEDDSDEDDGPAFDPRILDGFSQFEASAKMLKMVELLKQWYEESPEDKVIVYSQWTSCMDLLESLLEKEDMRPIRYDGKMNRVERAEAVKRFKRRDGPRIMLISLKCGGVGLNLVEANRVISFDLAWNYATESQAFDRVHRLGQVKDVTIKRLIVRDSIEERILQIQEAKQDLADAAFGEGSGKIRKLAIKDILKLFNMPTRNAD